MIESFRRRALRRVGWAIGIFASVLVAVLLALSGYLLLQDYPEKLRQALESQLTELSGSPARVRSVYLYLPSNAFELGGVEVRAPGREEPVLAVERIRGRLGLRALLGLELRFRELRFEGVSVSLLEDREEGLVLPSGRSEALRLAGITLAADRVEISHALLRVQNQKIPWTLEADNASLTLTRLRGARYEGTFAYDKGVLTLKDRGGVSASVTADIELVPGELFLRRGAATADFGQLSATGKVGFAGGVHARFDVEADGESGRLAESLFGLEGASDVGVGRGSFRGTLTLTPDSKTLAGTVVLPEGKLAGVPVSNWRGEFFWDRSMLSIGYAQGSFASGSAMVQLHQPLPVHEHLASLVVGIENASLASILEGVRGSSLPLESRVSGRGTFFFPASDPARIEGSFDFNGVGPVDPGAAPTPISFRGRAALGEGAIEIEELAFETSFLAGEVSGTVAREGPLSLAIDLAASDLAAAERFSRDLRGALGAQGALEPIAVEGSGRAVGRLRERFPHAVFEGELSAEGLRLPSASLESLRVEALVSRDAITFQGLSARSRGGTVSGRGSIRGADFEVDLSLSRWPVSELAGLPCDASGAASGTVSAARRGGDLDGGADLEIADAALCGLALASATARVVLDGSRVRIEPLSLARGGSVAAGNLEIDLESHALRGAVRAEGLVAPTPFRISGTLGGEVEISGTYDEPALLLTGRGEGIAVQGIELGNGPLSASLRGRDLAVNLDLETATGSIALESTVLLADDFLARGHLDWSGLDTARALGLARDEWSVLTLTSNGSADFQVPLSSPDPLRAAQAEAEVSSLSLAGPAYRVATVTPARLDLADGRLTLSRTALVEGDSRLFIGGELDLESSALDVEAVGVASLMLLQSFYPAIDATGETTLSARIGGTLERPAIEGHADFDSGSIRLEGFRQAVGGLRGRVIFDNRTIRIPRLDAVFGSGPIQVHGTIALAGIAPGSVDLTVEGSGVRLRYPEGLTATLEGELSLVGSAVERMVSGNLTLTDALWTREYDLVAGILSDRASEPLFADFAENELLKDLRLDVRIRAPGSLEVRNSLASIDASAELELRGTLGAPVLLGRSEATRGEIHFLGQRYDISSGKVDFVNPEEIEPFVELTAETRVRSYRVELRLTGTPERFYPELSSDPPLRTVDILRLLAGASDRELLDTLVGNETEELAGVGVASLLTERLSQEVGKRAERLFGLDRFSVNPFLVGQFANPTARVSLGKQITRELTVNYSTNLNAATQAIILVEYTPEGPMSWILSRDEEGDVGIDVKFRKSF
jgi:autotransporter translocation and assembly factor TamB